MVSVIITIPKETKVEMEDFPWVNWSEIAREQFIKNQKKIKALGILDELTKESTFTEQDCLKLGKLVKKEMLKKTGKG